MKRATNDLVRRLDQRWDVDMKLHVDKGTDALYLRLDDSTIVESEEVSPGIVLDYSESGEVVGVGVLHLSRRSSRMKLSTLEFETT